MGRSRSGFMIQDHSDPDASKGTDESLSRWCLAVSLNTWVILNAFHKCHNNLITMQWESRDLVMIRHQLILCSLKTRLSISCRSHFPHTVLVALHISRLHYLNQACQKKLTARDSCITIGTTASYAIILIVRDADAFGAT